MEESLDIVVCLRNSAHVFDDFLDSVCDKTSGNVWVNLIFVDNASRKADFKFYQKRISKRKANPGGVKNFEFVRNDHNYLYTKAVNIGAMTGEGEYILVLNPDIEILTDGFDEKIINDYKALGAGAMGFQLVKRSGFLEHTGVFQHKGNHRGRGDHVSLGKYDQPEECEWVTGAALFFSRAKYNLVGGLDDQTYPHFGSDRDFCYRLKEAGHTIWYYPMKFVHFLGGSTAPYVIDRDLPDSLKDERGGVVKKVWTSE